MQTTRTWDLPTRLFPWALAVWFVALVTTGPTGVFDWQFRLGYSVLTLLLFRLAWGFVGGQWSRFSSFAYAPSTILHYLRGRGQMLHNANRNPLGFLAVLALLHITAAEFCRVKEGQNLAAPMLHGDKEAPDLAPASCDDARSRSLALIILLICASLVAGMVRWTP